MPIYEYACEDCFHSFEIMQKISSEPVKACPECGKERVKRLVSAPQFKLKGTGWYETDFKTKPKSASEDNTKKAPKPDSTKANNTEKKQTNTGKDS